MRTEPMNTEEFVEKSIRAFQLNLEETAEFQAKIMVKFLKEHGIKKGGDFDPANNKFHYGLLLALCYGREQAGLASVKAMQKLKNYLLTGDKSEPSLPPGEVDRVMKNAWFLMREE